MLNRPDGNLYKTGQEHQRQVLGEVNTKKYQAATENYLQQHKINNPRDFSIPDLRQIIIDAQPDIKRQFLIKIENRLRIRFDIDAHPERSIKIYTSINTIYDHYHGVDAFVVYKDDLTKREVIFTFDVTVDPESPGKEKRLNRLDAVIFGDLTKNETRIIREIVGLIEQKIFQSTKISRGDTATTNVLYA